MTLTQNFSNGGDIDSLAMSPAHQAVHELGSSVPGNTDPKGYMLLAPSAFEAEHRQEGRLEMGCQSQPENKYQLFPSASPISSKQNENHWVYLSSLENVFLHFALCQSLPQVKHPSVKFYLVMLLLYEYSSD